MNRAVKTADLELRSRRFQRVAYAAGAAVSLTGIGVLFGWWRDIGLLKSLSPGLAIMKPNTALAFALAGGVLCLLCRPQRQRARPAVIAGGYAVVAIGALTLIQYLSGADFGIDRLLFKHSLPLAPRRMTPGTALNLVLMGSALLALSALRRPLMAQWLAILTLLHACLGLIGYIYGAQILYGVFFYSSVALHTTLAFIVLSVGVLLARPGDGLMSVFSSDTAGGMMARRLLAVSLLLPVLIGWLCLQGQRVGWYGTEFAFTLFVLSSLIIFTASIGWTAWLLHQMDLRRRQAAGMRFRELIESTPDAMIMVGRDGRIAEVNGQAYTLFGYSEGELLGQRVELLMPPRFREAHRDHRSGYFNQPRTRMMGMGLELFGRRKNGEEFPIEISLSPIRTEDGLMVSSAIRDITERKRFEQTLQEKNLELERASRAKDRFLATMSHELRTPLNAVIGFTGTLLMRLPGPLTAAQEKQLQTVQASARHLLSLINELLDLAKIEAGKLELVRESVDCRAVVEEVCTAMRVLAEKKELQFLVSLPEQTLAFHTNRRALNQILLNLVENAVKYTERGSIHLRAERRLRSLAISVEDTGPGIRPEDQRKLFAAFSRIDGAGQNGTPGTGLGLHLSRKLAELLGGDISFRSEYGLGSTFTLELQEE